MTGIVSRFLISALLSLCILMPQVSAALAGLGLADGRVVVICTGDGLRTIRIDENGEPAEISTEAEFCALVHATDTSIAATPATISNRHSYWIAESHQVPPVPAEQGLSRYLPRGPPFS